MLSRSTLIVCSIPAILVCCGAATAEPVAWVNQSSPGPSARYQFGLAYDSARDVTVMFGGTTNCQDSNNQIWEYNAAGGGWTQRSIYYGPSARFGHSMVYDSTRQVAMLFGGTSGAPNYSLDGVTWLWNGTSWVSRPTTGPSGRVNAAMAFDPVRDRVVLFGGKVGVNYLGDTWEWIGGAAGGTGQWVQHTAGLNFPAPRAGHAMAYDAARGVVVLFGGALNCSDNDGETWTYDGSYWRLASVTGPTERSGHSLVYDAGREVTVLYGGHAAAGLRSDTWEWNGSSWTQVNIAGPSVRSEQAMAYDTANAATVLFGGNNGLCSGFNQTWLLHNACGSADFNGDGDAATDADIESFFACIAGSCCATCDVHGADFNGDGDAATDADIESFFRVLAGGSC
jgi:hypothetical protein